MAEIVRMPKLSDTMTEGVVVKWHKKVGDQVQAGDMLADIETDKATMEFESFQDGTLLYIGVEVGKTAAVDSILAILGEEGEDIYDLLEKEKQNVEKSSLDLKVESEETDHNAEESIEEKIIHVAEEEQAKIHLTDLPSVTSYSGHKASPLARKLAREKGIDLNLLKGSGDHGRVVKRDVEGFNPALTTKKPTLASKEQFTETEVSQMRKAIARRLSESKFSAPHFYLAMSMEMDKMIEARKQINEIAQVKISFNDIIVKAVATALKQHPAVNTSWRDGKIRYNEHVHIGVAVAIEDGLIVPVIRFADTKSLTQIATEVRELAEKAKQKKLQPHEWEGNTFTISNLGMYGIEDFTAIINTPDACILAVGGIHPVAVVKDGRIVAGNVMKVTMSCDHRVVDGATGAQFLQTFKSLMENPILLFGQNMI